MIHLEYFAFSVFSFPESIAKGSSVRSPWTSYTEPSCTEPSCAEPNYIEPSYIEPSYIEPSYIEPSYIEPSGTEPSYIEPSYKEPSCTEPSCTEPSYIIEPSYIEPSYIEPSYIEPSGTEPSGTERGGTEPRLGRACVELRRKQLCKLVWVSKAPGREFDHRSGLRPSAEIRVVEVQKLELFTISAARDPLRRFAWSRFKN